jgi:ribosomal protein S18 acetylase RimI-like enzyme
MAIEYRNRYFDDLKAKEAFERYAINIFGLDFSLWKAKGLWDPSYIPFSAFDGDECIATICVYPSEMTIDNTPMQGAQLLTVGTRKEYRRQGIQRRIWQQAQAWISNNADFTFLFTDDEAAPFYERLGFQRQNESTRTLPLSGINPSAKHRLPGLRMLNLDSKDDYSIITRLASQREMVSNRIGYRNPNLLLFMFLYCYRDWTFYSDTLDAIFVIQLAGETIKLHDLVATRMPTIEMITPLLSQFSGSAIQFLFCADRLRPLNTTRITVSDSVLITCDRFNLPGDFVFPYSIRA